MTDWDCSAATWPWDPGNLQEISFSGGPDWKSGPTVGPGDVKREVGGATAPFETTDMGCRLFIFPAFQTTSHVSWLGSQESRVVKRRALEPRCSSSLPLTIHVPLGELFDPHN